MCELGWLVEGYHPSVVDMTTGATIHQHLFLTYSYANQPNFTDQQNI